jgi:hypothetical protein
MVTKYEHDNAITAGDIDTETWSEIDFSAYRAKKRVSPI